MIVQTIITMAHAFGFDVTAEGVETQSRYKRYESSDALTFRATCWVARWLPRRSSPAEQARLRATREKP